MDSKLDLGVPSETKDNDNLELSFDDLFGGTPETGESQQESSQPEKNVVLITTSFNGRLNFAQLLRTAEKIGPLKNHSFKEKQTFGFIQFRNDDSPQKFIKKLHNTEMDGFKLCVEPWDKITPGRDPRTHESNSEYKNSILVLKNLPFQLQKEKLEDILNSLEYKPLDVDYLYDNTRMFRGMAFVKYKEVDHATKVFEEINNMDINGRKLRVEYKRKTTEAEQDEEMRRISDQLMNLKASSTASEIAFNVGSSSYQKKKIHQMAEKLGLKYKDTDKKITVKKKEENVRKKEDNNPAKSQPIRASHKKKGEKNQIHSYDPKFSHDLLSPDRTFSKSYGTSPSYKHSVLLRDRNNPDGPILQPVRHPRGPDGTTGFSEEYRKSRTTK